MKAEKMFEDLGFIKNKSDCYNDKHIYYEQAVYGIYNSCVDIYVVEFKDGIVVYQDINHNVLKMNIKILKAILKQFQELGWLD